MIQHYILDGHAPKVVQDLHAWARWFKQSDRRVAQTIIGEVRISTVFLGLNHQWGSGPPILFETMVFGGEFDGEMDRYATWAEAEGGHTRMVAKVRAL